MPRLTQQMNRVLDHGTASQIKRFARNRCRPVPGSESFANLWGVSPCVAVVSTVPFLLCLACAFLLNLASGVKAQEKAKTTKKPVAAKTNPPTRAPRRLKPVKSSARRSAAKLAPSLPPGVTPPGELPEGSSSDEEWIVHLGKGNKRALANILSSYKREMLRQGNVESEKNRALFVEIIRWKLAKLTLKEYLDNPKKRQEIGKFRKDILADVRSARKSNTKSFDLLMKTLVAETPKLFQYHFVARLNGAWLLAELNVKEPQTGPVPKPAVPYIPAAGPLLELLKQQKQLEAVRIPAVHGLARIVADAPTAPELDTAIIAAFLNELKTGDPKQEFLPAVIACSLGELGIVNDGSRSPAVVQVLTKTMADHRRPFRVRCECAQALGRLPLDNTINVRLISYKIVELAEQMTSKLQKQEGANTATWKVCFWELYVAFRGDTKKNIEKRHGLMNKNFSIVLKKSVSDAYAQVLPIARAVLTKKQITPHSLTAMQQWLKTNAPANKKVHENFEEIISNRPIANAETETAG